MLIYIVILLFISSVALNVSYNRISQHNQRFLLNTIFILSIVMITFRSINVGTDYIHHNNSFLASTDLSFFVDSFVGTIFNEPLWYSLFYLINCQGLPITLFWFVYICLVWFFLIRSVPSGSSKLLVCSLFILSYFYYSSYNTSAQVLASILILCSVKEINQHNMIKAILYFVGALLIHKSSLFVIPFFILNYVSISKKWYYWTFAISFFILFMRIDTLLFSKFNEIMMLLDSSSNMSEYNKYFDMESSGLNIFGLAMNYFMIIANITIFIKVHSIDKNKLDIYSQWWAIGIIIYILTFNYAWLFRLSYFFMMSMIIAIPLRFNKKGQANMYTIVILLLCLIYVCKLYNNNDGIVPYEIL